MRLPIFAPLVVFIALNAACGEPKPDAVAADLTRLCTSMTELETREFADGFERSRAMGEALQGAVQQEATREFMRSLASSGTPQARMSALQAFAAEHGLPNYQCPALGR